MWDTSSQFNLLGQGLGKAIKWLLIATPLLYIVQMLIDRGSSGPIVHVFGLSREGMSHFFVWQLATYAFLHSGPFHLIINMLILWMFGRDVEGVIGFGHFLCIYFFSAVVGGLAWLIFSGPLDRCVGASGAIFGLIAAFVALFPHRQIMFFFVLSMPAWVMGVIIAVIEVLYLVTPGTGGTAYVAHLLGGVAGFFYIKKMSSVDLGRFTAAWKGKRRGLKVLTREPGSQRPNQSDVDQVLEKLADKGMNSLTSKEKGILEQASKDLRSGR